MPELPCSWPRFEYGHHHTGGNIGAVLLQPSFLYELVSVGGETLVRKKKKGERERGKSNASK